MTNESHQLLAKSLRAGRPPLTLQKHLKDTQDAAAAVFRLEGRWGRNWCNFFRLEGEELKKKFLLNLQVAGLFHDIGKANEDFYAALFDSKIIQTLRHEHLSALLLHLPEVRAWLKSNPLLDVEIITAAVLSHHLKAARDGDRKWCAPRTLKKRLKLHFQDPQVTATLHTVREIANLPPVPKLGINIWAAENPLWLLAKQDGFETADRFGLKSFGGKERRALLLAVKAGVIIAD